MTIRAVFEPRCAVGGVGSLPFTDAGEALDFVFTETPQLPAWPQLPQRGSWESMMSQFLWGGRTADGWVQNAAGFRPFLAEVGKHGVLAARGQLLGPATACCFREVTPEQGVEFLTRIAVWQAEQLLAAARPGTPVVVTLDEPMLLDRVELLEPVLEAIQGAGALSGLHCCGSPFWPWVFALPVDVISFDAARFLPDFLESRGGEYPVREYAERGGIFAWGLMPTTGTRRGDSQARSLLKKLRAVFGADTSEVLKRSMITPACGMGTQSVETTRLVFQKCHQASAILQEAIA
ncbi:hypothetical protein HZA57_06455 [Candidatus Poribacteria bacterium]|nr:hypothetical protein [Candidatus Poribacteria bacterium]